MKKRKAISPVVATVLLIAMAIVIGVIVILWTRGLISESIIKFGKNVELVCGEVQFEASYTEPVLYISNIGTVPIHDFKIKIFEDGSHSSEDLDLILGQGQTNSIPLDLSADVEKIILIPVLLGSSDEGEKIFVCDDQYGLEISLQ